MEADFRSKDLQQELLTFLGSWNLRGGFTDAYSQQVVCSDLRSIGIDIAALQETRCPKRELLIQSSGDVIITLGRHINNSGGLGFFSESIG